MDIVEAVKSGYANYVNFSGRSARPAFWYWVLFQIFVHIVIGLIFGGGQMTMGSDGRSRDYEGGLVANLWALANFLPGLAVSGRRLHDTGRSAWWLLIALIPLVGWIILIVGYCQESTPGANR